MSEQEVKDNIKSIITSNPLISTIQSVQKDYKEMIGTPIPYHKFNFNSLEHFLKNIPDTCVVNGTGFYAQVTLIPSKKSAHINEMVLQQKMNVKGRRKFINPRRKHTTGYPVQTMRKPSWQAPAFNYAFSPNSSFSSSSSVGNASSNTNFTLSNNYSSNVQTWTRNTSIHNKNTELKNTNIIQKTRQGTGIINQDPVRRVRNERTENTEEKRNHILEQNRMESRKVKENLDNLFQQQVNLGNVAKSSSTSPVKIPEAETFNNWNSVKVPDNASFVDHNSLNNLSINDNDNRQEYSQENSVTPEDIYFNKSKEKLNNLLYNFKSVDDELDEDTSNVPKRVQCNLKMLISQFNEGIWCSDVPGHYQKLFKKELTYMDYGYTSLIEMCVALKHIFHYVRPGRDDFKLYDRRKPLPENVEKNYTMASYDIGEKLVNNTTEALPELDWSDFKGHIPADVFQYGNEIPNEFFPEDTRVESIFDVVVVEIYDPSKFWIYLGTSDNNTPLDDLMASMQPFYDNPDNSREYAIPPGALKEGLYCVQVIYGEYHRARIIRVQTDCPDSVRVLYIDFGTVCKAPIKGMCFLHTKFAELNAQAIRCRLANIVPNLQGHPWPRTSSNRFREVVNRRDTKIKISYIHWKEKYVCVFLADVTDADNVHYINETLVQEEHAVWEGETQIVPFVLSNFTCKVQNIHLFPTFFELEYGFAPNASEMYALSDMLVPLQFCLPHYFEPKTGMMSSDDDIEEIENSFLETIRNHRKNNINFLSFVDRKTMMNPPPIDFDIFGDLKDDMMKFCDSIKATEGQQTPKKEHDEEELFCDLDEPAGNSLEYFEAIDRNLKELEPLRIMKEDKELSGSILEKLNKYSLLDSARSSNTEPEGVSSVETGKAATTLDSEHVDADDWWPPEEVVENDLSTIYENRNLKELEPLRIMKEVKERSGSILEKLKNYSLLDSARSSNSEPEGVSFVETGKSATTLDSKHVDADDWWPPEEMIENDLSTIYENSEMDLGTVDTPPDSPKHPFFGFGLNVAQSRPDINIFDNPEEFEGASSDTSDSGSRPTPESFLRTIDRICRSAVEEEIKVLEEVNENTEISTAECSKSTENPFKFVIAADLKEAFNTFLKSQKRSNSGDSGYEQSPSLPNQFEEPLLPGNDSSCQESFLKCDSQRTRFKEKDVQVGEERKENDFRGGGSTKTEKSNLDLPFKSKLEETRSCLSTLSLNNPFRPYLELQSSDSTEYLSTVAAENEDHTETTKQEDPDTTLPFSSSADLSRNMNLKLETPSTKTSDSDNSSDYKVFAPIKFNHRLADVTKQEACGSWVQSSMAARGMSTPPKIATPPRMCTPPPPGCVPMGYPPYPQWSNGSGYPVPQYTQWSTGSNYSVPSGGYGPQPRGFVPPPPHLREAFGLPPRERYVAPPRESFGPPPPRESFGPQPPRESFGPQPPRESFGPPPPQESFGPPAGTMLRPPPGFAYQGPPQNLHPYMTQRMLPGPPAFLQGPPMYYGHPRHPPIQNLVTERDFYERYNEAILRQSTESS